MGGGAPTGPQSWAITSLFLFNVIVGTGVLALPNIFANAGLALATIFLFLTVMFSYMVNTWLVETMSTVSALQQQSDNNTREPVNFASNWMEQHGSMVLVVLPRWGQILWFVTIVLYLFGDLAVYAVFVPKTIKQVFPVIHIGSLVLEGDWVYYATLILMIVFITPWVFFTFAKTLVLQIITTVTRHFVFWVMIISAFQRDIDPAERANDVKSFDFTQIPLLFGGIVYACICQHYIPQMISPVTDKKKVNWVFYTVFTGVTIYYLILSWTGVWAFSRMLPEACTPAGPCRPQQLYTFNFSYLKPSWFGSTIEVLPLLALLTNFPLLAITLRDNLIVLFKLVAQTIQQRNDKEHGQPLIAPTGDSLNTLSPRSPVTGRSQSYSVSVARGERRRRLSFSNRLRAVSDTALLLRTDLMAPPTEPKPRPPLRLRIAVALLACAPPFTIAFLTTDIDSIVGITGSFGGAIIMFIMPTLYVYYARQKTKKVINRRLYANNPYKSWFQGCGWQIVTLLFAFAAMGFNVYSYIDKYA